MEPTPKKKKNKVAIALFAVAFVFFAARFVVNAIQYSNLTSRDESPSGRSLAEHDAAVQKQISEVEGIKGRLWPNGTPGNGGNDGANGTESPDASDDGYTIRAPYNELWNDWQPWSNWKNIPEGDVALPFNRVDLSDGDIDFDVFRALYKQSSETDRILCLQDIMRFDLTRKDLTDERRREILSLFKDMASHDKKNINIISTNFALTLRLPGLLLDRFFQYAEIISAIINESPEPAKRHSRFIFVLRHYKKTMDAQLSLIDDPGLRAKLAPEVKKWFTDTDAG